MGTTPEPKYRDLRAYERVSLILNRLPVDELVDSLLTIHISLDGDALGHFCLQGAGATLYVADFFVRDDFQGVGYGSAAIQKLIELAVVAGYAAVEGAIEGAGWERRDRLINFYSRVGCTFDATCHEDRRIGFSLALPETISDRRTTACP